MTIYTWDQQSPVERMEVLPFGKQQEAILHARDGADTAQLSAMRNLFHSQGMAVVPDEVDGKPVLRLRGFESEEYLAASIEQNGFADAGQRQTAKSEKKKSNESFVEKIRGKSFVLAGYVYMIGDAALAVSGIKRGDTNETMSGLAYGATSVVAARYGERKQEKVFEDLYTKMLGEFAREGVELPEGAKITSKELGKPGGLVERIEKFLYDNPTNILTAGNAIAGFNLFRAGVNQGSNDKRIAGALVMTGMLTGLLVPEKAKKEAPKKIEDIAAGLEEGASNERVWVQPEMEKPKGLLGMLTTARDWVQEKPLRVGGYLAMGNNYFMAKGALSERQSNPMQREYLTRLKNGQTNFSPDLTDGLKKKLTKAEYQDMMSLSTGTEAGSSAIDAKLQKLEKSDGMWKMNMTAAASYLVANGLLSISSTKGGHGGGGKDKDGKEKKDPNAELYAAAAAIISNQPQEMQETCINKMAAYLASQNEIHMAPEELADKMREKVATVKDNPWLDPAKHGKAAPAPQEPRRFADSVGSKNDMANAAAWADKEAARAKDTGLSGATR